MFDEDWISDAVSEESWPNEADAELRNLNASPGVVPTTEQDPLHTRPTRREKRKEAEDAMVICRALVELPEQKLAKIPIPEDLAVEVATARKIRSNAAKKRQMLFLAKIMRQCDEQEDIALALRRLSDLDRRGTAEFQRLEAWRTRLLEENDDAVEIFCQKYPHASSQELRELIQNVHRRTGTHRTAASRALFRELRRIVVEGAPNSADSAE